MLIVLKSRAFIIGCLIYLAITLKPANVEKLTEFAGLRRFNATSDGKAVYAEQIRDGYSELVKVDISTGTITPLFKKSLNTAYDYPTLSPDNKKISLFISFFKRKLADVYTRC